MIWYRFVKMKSVYISNDWIAAEHEHAQQIRAFFCCSEIEESCRLPKRFLMSDHSLGFSKIHANSTNVCRLRPTCWKKTTHFAFPFSRTPAPRAPRAPTLTKIELHFIWLYHIFGRLLTKMLEHVQYFPGEYVESVAFFSQQQHIRFALTCFNVYI